MLIPILIAVGGIIAVLAWLTLEYSLLVLPCKGLPILMYHRVSGENTDRLTISAEKLEEQLFYLRDKGYHAISFPELKALAESGNRIPARTVILTFDDAYQDFYTHAWPLLKKYSFKATVFVPVAYMGKQNSWDNGHAPLMTADTIRGLALNEPAEIGLHSFLHRGYGELAPEDMQEDLDNCFRMMDFYRIPFVKVLAYPYGSYPKKDKERMVQMKQIFRQNNLDFAVRIGNRVNPFPIRDPYEMKRIDIRGTDSFATFRIKLKKGRKKLFS
jgi:peptidoglycan/xylan/chitin deacetylase (PgdA/CDA1 family)